MKLQRHKTRKDKPYYKYVIVIPEEIVKKSDFSVGQGLKASAKKGEIRVRKCT